MKHYEKGDHEGMPYRLMSPDSAAKQKTFPLVLSLHGGGGRGTDNIRNLAPETEILAMKENREEYPCFVLAPQCPKDSNWSFPNVMRPRMTEELVASYLKPYQNRFIRLSIEPDKALAPAKQVPYGIGDMDKVMRLVHKMIEDLPIDNTAST